MSLIVSMFAFVAFTADQPANTNRVEPQPVEEKKICKIDPEDTDSRIRRRICKTASEWSGDKAKGDGAGAKNSAPSNH